MQAALLVWLAVLFANLGHVAEAFLTPTMERVSAALRVPPRLAGVTLLAWANGAPDLSANVAAMRANRVDMALGSALGAGMFVTCLVGGSLARVCNGIKVGGAMVRNALLTMLMLLLEAF
jgi:solute carrier family 24 (sodium/potassium/calcium exchanger), member 6